MALRFLKSQVREARHDRHAAICNACDYHDVCGGCCRGDALGVSKGGVSDDATGYGAEDSGADGIGARDGATGAGVFDFEVSGA